MPRSLVRAAVTGLLIATPVATWWHVGPLGTDDSGVSANVLFRPPRLGEATEAVLGRVGTALVAASTTILLMAAGRGAVDRRSWRVVTPLVLLGAFCGAYWRVLTATTPGWDIGSTLLGIFVAVPFGIVVIVALAVWTGLAWNSLRSTDHLDRG